MCNKNMKHSVMVEGIGKIPEQTKLYVKLNDGMVELFGLNGEAIGKAEASPVLCQFEKDKTLPAFIKEHLDKETEVEVLQWGQNALIPISNLSEFEKGTFLTLRLNGNIIDVYTKAGILIKQIPAGEWRSSFKRRKELKGYIHHHEVNFSLIQIVHWADLHRHSGYSLLDGATKVKDMVSHTDFVGALTDHGNMFGAVEYYQTMKSANKLPILGFEAYCETIDGSKKGNHLWLVAKNDKGIQNLMKLTTLSYENIYRKPHISYEMLEKYGEGIISSTSCMGSEINALLQKREYEKARDVAKAQMKFFGEDDYYVEIQRHGFMEEDIVNPQLMKLSRELGIKLLATTDSHYTNKEDSYSHEVLLCIGTKKKITDRDRLIFPGTDYHLHSIEEIEEKFADIPEALDATLEVAEKCAEAKLALGVKHMPKFPISAPFATAYDQLHYLVEKGFNERFEGMPELFSDTYIERKNFEMSVIKNMNYADYFLIVGDSIKFAHDSGIWTGPGRGSGAGSLVLFCLKVTDICPIPYGLLFERFLNPERISDPDVDLDFEDERRPEMFEYVKKKYGERNVSRIITFMKLGAKTSVRDVTRVLDLPLSLADKIAKLIPAKPNMTLKKAYEESQELRELLEESQDAKKIFDIATLIEGLPRNPSVHACGVIIAEDEILNFVPETIVEDKKTKEKIRVTQFQMADVEAMGMLKMDFLGLRTMSVNKRTLNTVNKTRSEKGLAPLSYDEIPITDKQVYEAISKGESYGVFQLESAGMRNFMKDLFGDTARMKKGTMELFERLVAGVSLYRPGPLDYIPDYLKNMKEPQNIVYDHPKLKPILEPTYGVIVYQEQCMTIVRELAGFTKGQADEVRKAFAKKLADKIEPLRLKFYAGCTKSGISESISEKVWKKMESFASYAFNKSHAAAYSIITAKGAYLKTYYPVEYMCSILNSYLSNPDKLKIFLNVTKKMDIRILPPSVNDSVGEFAVKNGNIIFGLQGLKGMGKAGEWIEHERNSSRGAFTSVQDVCERLAKHEKFDKKMYQILVCSGALDEFGYSRKALLSVEEDMLNYIDSVKKDAKKVNVDQLSFFDFMEEEEVQSLSVTVKIPLLEEMEKRRLLDLEKEYVGFFLTAHPLDDYEDNLIEEHVYELVDIMTEPTILEDENGEIEEIEDEEVNPFIGERVKIAGIVQELRTIHTRKGDKMFAFELEDRTSKINAVVFPKQAFHLQQHIAEGKVLVLDGVLDKNDFGYQLIVSHIIDVEEIKKLEMPKLVWVKTFNRQLVDELFEYVSQNEGLTPVNVIYNGNVYQSKKGLQVNYKTFSKLREMFGSLVKVEY